MIGALKYELVRIRTIRSSYWMSALALVMSAGITVVLCLVVNAARDSVGDDLGRLSAAPEFSTWIVTAGGSAVAMPILSAAFFAVMGAMAMGHEYRYGTNKATLTANPDRIAVFTAKALVLAGWVAATAVLILLVNLVIGWLFVDGLTFDGATWRPVIFFVLYCVGFALAGMGLATMMRSQVGAIVTVLVWPLAIEPIVFSIIRAVGVHSSAGLGKIANLMPASAGRRTMFRPYEFFASLDNQSNVWGLGASAVVFWVGVAILVVAGTALFISRDA